MYHTNLLRRTPHSYKTSQIKLMIITSQANTRGYDHALVVLRHMAGELFPVHLISHTVVIAALHKANELTTGMLHVIFESSLLTILQETLIKGGPKTISYLLFKSQIRIFNF